MSFEVETTSLLMPHYIFTLIAFLFLGILNVGLTQEWDLVKEKKSIKVYTRKVEGKKIKELKITTQYEASLSSIVRILEDVEAHPDWVYKCSDSRFSDYVADDEFYYYIIADFPFPVLDRDMIIYYKREQDPVTKVITTTSIAAPDKEETYEDLIRVQEFESTYIITPRKGGFVDIEYTLSSDPAGSIPTWIINLAIAKGPIKTMERMAKELKKEKYANAKVVGVEELY